MGFEIKPVATVFNNRKTATDDFWGDVVSEIRLVEGMPADAFEGIEDFSHVEVIFVFDKAVEDQVVKGSSHPRGNKNWPRVGIYAQRKKDRPNHIGITVCEILRKDGKSLFVKKLDAIDGTPVIDIKPVMKEFLPETPVKQPSWATELMKDYWKK
jgi:tRNA-Thr(GGU) m(6)t(6)A37 methyltransferase TsaA